MLNYLKITVIFEDRDGIKITKEMCVPDADYRHIYFLAHALARPFYEAFDEYIEKQRSRVMKGGD